MTARLIRQATATHQDTCTGCSGNGRCKKCSGTHISTQCPTCRNTRVCPCILATLTNLDKE